MAKLTEAMKSAMAKTDLYPFATASKTCVPNVIPVKYVFVENDAELWIVDNYLLKTLQNVQENPVASLYVNVSEDKICFQIKGEIEIKSSGPDFESMKQQAHQIKSDLPARSLLVMHITGIFQCRPGQQAGEEIV